MDIAADERVITGNLLHATADKIKATLQRAGTRLGAGRGERLRRAFVHYLENAEVASREVQPGLHGHGAITMAKAEAVRVTFYRAWGAGS